MECNNYEFRAPQYFDFYSVVEGILEQNEDNSYCGTLNGNVHLNTSGNQDQNCFLTPSDFAVLKHTNTAHLFSMKSGERNSSQKLSSVLCEERSDHSSYVMKQAFSDALDNVILSSPGRNETKISKLNKKPFKDEAYLFNSRAKINKKKEHTLLLVKDGEKNKLHAKEEDSTYRGMAVTNSFNRTTEVRPFSFQERNEEFLKKKQQKLAKAREQTQEVTEFQARPVPPHILINKMNLVTPRKDINKKPAKEKAEEERILKAKNEVLHKESLVPVRLQKTPLTTIRHKNNNEKIAKENKVHQVKK